MNKTFRKKNNYWFSRVITYPRTFGIQIDRTCEGFYRIIIPITRVMILGDTFMDFSDF